MRLLVVTQYFWPENFRINDLVSELVVRGHDVTVVTGKPNYPDGNVFAEFINQPSNFNSYKGANIIRIPMLARGRGNFFLIINYLTFAISASVLGAWKLRKFRFDAIFVYEPSPITVGIPGVFFRALKKVPLVFWVLDLWPETLEAVGVLRKKRALKLVGYLVAYIYKRCDLILAQSKSFIPKIIEYSYDNARIEYFPGWSEIICGTQKSLPAPEIVSDGSTFNIVFAGNIGQAQDFPSILSAAEVLKDNKNIRWLILGDGREADWVKNELKLRGLEHCVLMLGRYPIERMPSFFAHANALLVSLKDEPIFSMTIPAKLQTYLSVGVPILAMLNGEGADIVSRAGAGISCPAGDHKALADAILTLSNMTAEERLVMGLNASLISNEQFSREKLIDQLELWLEDLCTSRC